MRSITIGLSVLLVATALAGLAPTSSAAMTFCTAVTHEDCGGTACWERHPKYGYWTKCTGTIIVCVMEPCPGLP